MNKEKAAQIFRSLRAQVGSIQTKEPTQAIALILNDLDDLEEEIKSAM